MSTTTEFEQLKETIAMIDEKQVLTPVIPMGIYNQEAEDLYRVAIADKEKLTKRGLNVDVLEALTIAAGASRYAEAEWIKERNAKQEAEIMWREKSPEAYELKDDLIDEFEYAFYQKHSLLSVVNRIKVGNGHADMIQDLMSLALLGKDNPESLSETNFDMSLLLKAESMADQMSDLLAIANGTKDEENEIKIFRDKTFTYLKEHVDTVRRIGKFVFRNDRNHVGKYASEHGRR